MLDVIQKYKHNYSLLPEKIKADIISSTSSLPVNSSLPRRIYHIKNNLFSVPLCICKKECLWTDKHLYKKTCGDKECAILQINITKSPNQEKIIAKTRNAIKQKYGVDNYSKTDLFKNTVLKENNFSRQEIKEKIKNTVKQKYNVDNVAKSKIIQEKIIKTNNEKYDVDYKIFDPTIRNKRKRNVFLDESYKKTFVDRMLEINKQKFVNNLSEEYELVKYNGKEPIELLHKKCNEIFIVENPTFYSRTKRNFEICTFCNKLQKNYSNGEIEIAEFIKQNYCGIILNNEKIDGIELDIYLPELNLAIEFNGLYWHSSLFKNKNYHKNKTDKCEKLGINLIHIWEDDWENKQKIVKSILLNYLNKQKIKIYARNTVVQTIINNTVVSDFLENNHLQGYNSSTICYGLYHDNELVQLISFVYWKNKQQWEIQRLCTKLDCQIIGGTEKLWKHFLKENNPNFIFTYSSRDYFFGSIYEKLGMKFEKITEPSLFYTNGKIRLNRQKFQKKKLIKNNLDKTKFAELYNSGNKKFILQS
jgi:hypothetical protein